MLLRSRQAGFGGDQHRNVIGHTPRTGNPQYTLQDQGIFDSRCSRHMTGNNFLQIIKRLMVDLLHLEEVLKETECLRFYLPDSKLHGMESQVLLKVPRQNNMYSFDLKNVVPSGDPLGKFDEKADEGFFVGYSINSKAFRVFNTRTRKVEENLHINFLENKPNVAGSGPDWLFDIDLYKTLMNYDPQSSEDAVADDAGKKTNEEPANEGERNGQEKEGGASNKEDDQNVQDFRAELDNLLVQQKEGYANSTNREDPLCLIWKVYVDEIIFGSTKKSLCVKFEWMMHKRFQMSSMGELTFFLGLQVKQKDDGIFISQDKYVANILKKFDLALQLRLTRHYSRMKKHDIMFAVCVLCKVQLLLKFNLYAVKGFFRYLKARMDGRTCNIKQMCVKSQTPRQVKRGRDIKIPQSGGLPEKVGDEAIH
ncbi:uncharacterized mitochondrial protein-like protein [Tanacetum coccineum]